MVVEARPKLRALGAVLLALAILSCAACHALGATAYVVRSSGLDSTTARVAFLPREGCPIAAAPGLVVWRAGAGPEHTVMAARVRPTAVPTIGTVTGIRGRIGRIDLRADTGGYLLAYELEDPSKRAEVWLARLSANGSAVAAPRRVDDGVQPIALPEPGGALIFFGAYDVPPSGKVTTPGRPPILAVAGPALDADAARGPAEAAGGIGVTPHPEARDLATAAAPARGTRVSIAIEWPVGRASIVGLPAETDDAWLTAVASRDGEVLVATGHNRRPELKGEILVTRVGRDGAILAPPRSVFSGPWLETRRMELWPTASGYALAFETLSYTKLNVLALKPDGAPDGEPQPVRGFPWHPDGWAVAPAGDGAVVFWCR